MLDTSAAEAMDGVVHVLTPDNAPPLAETDDRELAILRDAEIGFRGQYLGAVVATTPEQARRAADLVEVTYETEPHDTDFRRDHPSARLPEDPDSAEYILGDVDAALADADIVVDAVYGTPMEHNNPMEPHTTVARWDDDELTLWLSTQGAHPARDMIAPILGLDREQIRIINPHVGGGFGS